MYNIYICTIVYTMMNIYQSEEKNKVFQQHGHASKLDEKACSPPSLQ